MTPLFCRRLKLQPKSAIDADSATITHKSRESTYPPSQVKGCTRPLTPTTASVLKKLEPMMLPITKSFCPLRAETIAEASSGSDVPAATTASVDPSARSNHPNVS